MEEVGLLNNDIPMNVLSRLPTKDLLSWKCVSKAWYSLISDRSFIKFQLKKKEPVMGLLFQEKFQWCSDDIRQNSFIPVERKGAEVRHTVFDFLPEDVTILASSNGLVCCRSCLPSPDPVIYVCNPSNKDWVSLKWDAPEKQESFGLAFDPFQDVKDISTNFKVVRVSQMVNNRGRYFSFNIYASVTGEWKISKEICECNHNFFKNKGNFIGGRLHWLTDGDQILTFDAENELTWLLEAPFPTTIFKSIPEMCIGESQGRLHYVIICDEGLLVWELEDYYVSKWRLIFSISLEEMEKENPLFLCNISKRVAQRLTFDMDPWIDPLAFKDGVIFMRVSASIYSYQLETRKLNQLCCVSKLGPNSLLYPTMLPYSMSLVPLRRA